MSKKNNEVVVQLEDRVQATVGLIQGLKQDNRRLSKEYSKLQDKIVGYEQRVIQLEKLIGDAEREQKHLERSVMSALSTLDDVDDLGKPMESTTTTRHTSSKASETVVDDIFSDNKVVDTTTSKLDDKTLEIF